MFISIITPAIIFWMHTKDPQHSLGAQVVWRGIFIHSFNKCSCVRDHSRCRGKVRQTKPLPLWNLFTSLRNLEKHNFKNVLATLAPECMILGPFHQSSNSICRLAWFFISFPYLSPGSLSLTDLYLFWKSNLSTTVFSIYLFSALHVLLGALLYTTVSTGQ